MILTYNEEANIRQALASVAGWSHEVFLLDSLSSDRTLEIARNYPCQIVEHEFLGYGAQRNYALENLPIRSEWVLFLDADEWLPDAIKDEISGLVAARPAANGFYLNRRLIWMGSWIRRGYYPSWILRLVRRGTARCESRSVNEHLIVEGATGKLDNDFVHEDRKGITAWIAKHNEYATREAQELMNCAQASTEEGRIQDRLWGTQPERKRWIRHKIWNRLPPLVRPWLYFAYRYILTGGWLDGSRAFTYHFLQALWFPLLIDVKYLEMKRQLQSERQPPAEARG